MDADDFFAEGSIKYIIDNYLDYKFDVISYFSTSVNEGDEERATKKDTHGEIKYETTGHALLAKGECSIFAWMC